MTPSYAFASAKGYPYCNCSSSSFNGCIGRISLSCSCYLPNLAGAARLPKLKPFPVVLGIFWTVLMQRGVEVVLKISHILFRSLSRQRALQ